MLTMTNSLDGQDVTSMVIIYSKRKTLTLHITEEGKLIVRAPLRTSEQRILQFVQKSRGWILKHQTKARQKQQQIIPKQFVDGEKFLYLGEHLELRVAQTPNIFLSDFLYLPKEFLTNAKKYLINWYQKMALEVFEKRVKYHAAKTGLQFTQIKISNAKHRWGSCSAKNVLNFTWNLIMAPIEVIDYIIIHELVHTVEKNHSRNYWNKVAKIMPNYKQQEKWLKENGVFLRLE